MTTLTNRSANRCAYWQAVIERAEQSPLSIAAFCRTESINPASFYRWRQRLRAAIVPTPATATAQPTFLDLGTLDQGPADANCWELELDLGGGILLRLRRG